MHTPDHARNAGPTGRVTIVGAGPGAADLLTLRAVRALACADVVLHDALIGPEILDFAPPSALRIDVGKRAGARGAGQARINALLVAHARRGVNVVRVKGGDPAVFGRLGEELLALWGAGIPCEIVPGITAASGCAAAAGMPLTDRGNATSVRYVAAQRADDAARIDWASLARCEDTLVFYMGGRRIAQILDALVEHGRAPDTPIAVIERGTLAAQRIHLGDLGRTTPVPPLGDGPVLLVVGDVVRYALLSGAAQAPRQAATRPRTTARLSTAV